MLIYPSIITCKILRVRVSVTVVHSLHVFNIETLTWSTSE